MHPVTRLKDWFHYQVHLRNAAITHGLLQHTSPAFHAGTLSHADEQRHTFTQRVFDANRMMATNMVKLWEWESHPSPRRRERAYTALQSAGIPLAPDAEAFPLWMTLYLNPQHPSRYSDAEIAAFNARAEAERDDPDAARGLGGGA